MNTGSNKQHSEWFAQPAPNQLEPGDISGFESFYKR